MYMEKNSEISQKIVLHSLKKEPKNLEQLNAIKRLILRSSDSANTIPTTSDLLKSYHELVQSHKIKKSSYLERLLTKRAVRTLSGVTIITVLTKPFPCPGKCIYCPTEERMPKSYLSDEPAANRALSLKFDPYEQVRQRIKALENNGHPTDKIELIVKGGTWNAYPVDYQYWFILRCFEACNQRVCRMNFSSLRMHTPASDRTPASVLAQEKLTQQTLQVHSSAETCSKVLTDLSKVLTRAQTKNETAKHRIIGLTLETRPDFINEENIKIMRELGCTRIEMGVQTIDNKILKTINRGHSFEEVITATKLLKDFGFKVDYHLMPQLPGSTPSKDLKMMLKIFNDPNYRPDMIKIYPCTVIKNSELYDWLKAGKYKPYSDRKLIDILKQFKTQVPRYVRISRLIRDIPSHHIQAGNKMTNLRQVIQNEMKNGGLKCNCLRCREVGHSPIDASQLVPKLFIDKYAASDGTEYFLSLEDKKRSAVFAFCRLRVSHFHGKGDPMSYPAYIRELHTYGQLIEIGKKDKKASQHTGLGKKMIAEAEKICRKAKIEKLAVISGVGVRGYYKKLGFKLENTYMVKKMK